MQFSIRSANFSGPNTKYATDWESSIREDTTKRNIEASNSVENIYVSIWDT